MLVADVLDDPGGYELVRSSPRLAPYEELVLPRGLILAVSGGSPSGHQVADLVTFLVFLLGAVGTTVAPIS